MTRTTRPFCRQCGADRLDDLGRIPSASSFAGLPLPAPMDGGRLFQCTTCGLGFRHPVLTEEAYERLYASVPLGVWHTHQLRPDQERLLKRVAAELPAGDVLDVGCYDGSLLAAMGPQYRKFGVEASVAAGQLAAQRGVQVLATRIRDLAQIGQQFDCICAVDVIEHVHQPKDFLALLAASLRPGGSIFVSTGSLDSPEWRAAGGSYWYCGYADHISFICSAWAERVGKELGLQLGLAESYAYGPDVHDAAAKQKMRAQFHQVVRKSKFKAGLIGVLPAPWGNAPPRHSYGMPGVFEDHFLLSFKKPLGRH